MVYTEFCFPREHVETVGSSCPIMSTVMILPIFTALTPLSTAIYRAHPLRTLSPSPV